jgi:hypothetical protein
MFKDEGRFFIKFFCIVLYLEFKGVICNGKCKIPCFNLIVNSLDECQGHCFCIRVGRRRQDPLYQYLEILIWKLNNLT